MRPSEGDYGEGVTVIDITDTVPRYCMVFPYLRDSDDYALPPYVPLTAEEFLTDQNPMLLPWKARMRRSEVQQQVLRLRKVIQPLNDLRLIDIGTLAAIWPEDFGPDADHEEARWWDEIKYLLQEKPWADRIEIRDDKSLMEGDRKEVEMDGVEELPSLTTLATFQSVRALSQSDVTVEHLEYLLQIPMAPGPIIAVRNLLFAQSKLPDSVLPFLAKNIQPEQDGFVDASALALSDGQLVAFMKCLPECRILKLGARVNVKPEEIAEVVRILPNIQLVMIFDRNISITQVEEIRRNVTDNRVMIAHKWEYFQYISWFNISRFDYELFYKSHFQYRPSNSPEFLFLSRHPKSDQSEAKLGGVGIEVIEDLDHIIQAIRDIARLSPGLHMPAAIACLTAAKRTYKESFSSKYIAKLVSCAPRLERELEGKVQWVFLYGELEKEDCFCEEYVKFGFIRHQHGSPLQVMDVDGFVQTISKERPDLPLTLGTDSHITDHGEPNVASFLSELRYLFGDRYQPNRRERPWVKKRHPCKLWTVEEAEEILNSL